MDRTVAVTGGSGKLGRAVVAALIQEGWTVVNFDRVPAPDSRARFIRTDLTRPARRCLATRSTTRPRTFRWMKMSRPLQKSFTPLPRISRRRWRASTAGGIRIRR